MLHKHAHIQQSEFVNTYSAYMNEFRVAMQTLAKYEQSSLEFKQLLLKCQHTCGCKGLSLSAYLLTPIQRLPRYELLLKVRPSDISAVTDSMSVTLWCLSSWHPLPLHTKPLQLPSHVRIMRSHCPSKLPVSYIPSYESSVTISSYNSQYELTTSLIYMHVR